MTATRIVEVSRTRTPFGVRFWDAATDQVVAEGLTVVIRRLLSPVRRSPRRIPAFVTRSGVHAFRGLDNLQEWEMPAQSVGSVLQPGFDSNRDPIGTAAAHVVEVVDRQRRFVNMAFEVEVPHLGLPAPPAHTAGPVPQSLYLFPAPGRSAVRSLCGLRAHVVDPAGRPLAGAVLTIEVDQSPDPAYRWAGVADDRGNVVVLFPFPTGAVAGLPAPGPDPRISVTIAVRATAVPTNPSGGSAEIPTVQELFEQPPAAIQFRPDPLVKIRPSGVTEVSSPLASAQLSGRLIVSPN